MFLKYLSFLQSLNMKEKKFSFLYFTIAVDIVPKYYYLNWVFGMQGIICLPDRLIH